MLGEQTGMNCHHPAFQTQSTKHAVTTYDFSEIKTKAFQWKLVSKEMWLSRPELSKESATLAP